MSRTKAAASLKDTKAARTSRIGKDRPEPGRSRRNERPPTAKGGDALPHLLPAWSPMAPGVAVERDARTGRVYALSHPGSPYVVDSPLGPVTDNDLRSIATGYIQAVNELLLLPPAWIATLGDLAGNVQAFLAPRWTDFDGDPRHSFRSRRLDAAHRIVGESAVVLATLTLDGVALHGGQALRVNLHVDRDALDGHERVRVTGLTSTLPDPGNDSTLTTIETQAQARLAQGGALPSLSSIVAFLSATAARLAGLPASTTFVDHALRVPDLLLDIDALWKNLQFTMKTVDDEEALHSLSYEVAIRPQSIDRPFDFVLADKSPLLANASAPAATAKVFALDPVTRFGSGVLPVAAPHHSAKHLDHRRSKVTLPGVTPGTKYGTWLLKDGAYIDVVTSALDRDAPSGAPQTFEFDPAQAYRSRTNVQAAVNAYLHFEWLVLRMQHWNIDVGKYLKFTTTALRITYRGEIVPGGRDGKTVNAQVRWRIAPPIPASGGGTTPGVGVLDTNLALADLRMSPATAPLGIACDPRWVWHEFGHVLLAGTTGSLELAFAHSCGDALSAIVHDPVSALVMDPAWRGNTFPWVSLPGRRHDREAADGWSWSGSFCNAERTFAHGNSNRQGYWTEQILSSSLFRMYRCLGGDALAAPDRPHRKMRLAAADHALYLVVAALEAIGPASGATALTPENFVAALLHADSGLNELAPLPSISLPPRLGGMAQKVARWAFEQQGAFPDKSRPFPCNGPGRPPAVDIFIDSGIPRARRGGYEPFTFLADDWHARPDAVWVQSGLPGTGEDEDPLAGQDNYVFVRVENCGAVTALSVNVEVFAARNLPDWPSTQWKSLMPAASGTSMADVPAAPGKRVFGPFVWPKTTRGRHSLFVTATCSEDRSIIDPVTNWPSATAKQPLALRVALDNNLGLRVVKVV